MESEIDENTIQNMEQNIQELHYEIDTLIEYLKDHRKIIRGLMYRLQEQDSEECKKIYRECLNSSIYLSYYDNYSQVQET